VTHIFRVARVLLYWRVHPLIYRSRSEQAQEGIMAQALESERRQHTRDGILETLADISYAVLRRYDIGHPAPAAEFATAAAPANQ